RAGGCSSWDRCKQRAIQNVFAVGVAPVREQGEPGDQQQKLIVGEQRKRRFVRKGLVVRLFGGGGGRRAQPCVDPKQQPTAHPEQNRRTERQRFGPERNE